jgi:hypothetical protein
MPWWPNDIINKINAKCFRPPKTIGLVIAVTQPRPMTDSQPLPDSQRLDLPGPDWLVPDHGNRRGLRRALEPAMPAWLEAAALGPKPVRADLLDTSAGGVCLALASPCTLQPGDAVQVSSGEGPARGGQVRWRQQTALIVALGVAYDDNTAES